MSRKLSYHRVTKVIEFISKKENNLKFQWRSVVECENGLQSDCIWWRRKLSHKFLCKQTFTKWTTESERPKLLFSFSQCACSWCVNLIEFKLSFRLNLCCLFSSSFSLFFHLTTTLAIWMCIRDQHIKNSFLCWHYFHAQFMPSCCCCSYFSVFTMTIF